MITAEATTCVHTSVITIVGLSTTTNTSNPQVGYCCHLSSPDAMRCDQSFRKAVNRVSLNRRVRHSSSTEEPETSETAHSIAHSTTTINSKNSQIRSHQATTSDRDKVLDKPRDFHRTLLAPTLTLGIKLCIRINGFKQVARQIAKR